MKYIFCLLMISIVILSGCQNNNNNESTLKNEATQQPIPSSSMENNDNENIEDEKKSYENMFFPPNFVVKKMDFHYEDKKLDITLEYVFNAELYHLLKEDNADFSFIITYPEDLVTILAKEQSELINAEEIKDDGKLNYKMQYTETFEDEITPEQFAAIARNMSYNLYILNSEEKVFSILNGFRYQADRNI